MKKKTPEQKIAERVKKRQEKQVGNAEKRRNDARLEYPVDVRIDLAEKLHKEAEAESEADSYEDPDAGESSEGMGASSW